MSFFLLFTFVRHHFASLEVHLGTTRWANLVDVIAQLVAAVLPAAQAKALVKGFFGVAAVGHALLLSVQQRVDEQVDGAFVRTFDKLVHVWNTQSTENMEPLCLFSDYVTQQRKFLPYVWLCMVLHISEFDYWSRWRCSISSGSVNSWGSEPAKHPELSSLHKTEHVCEILLIYKHI